MQSMSSRLWFRVWAWTTFGQKTSSYLTFFHSDHETAVENTQTHTHAEGGYVCWWALDHLTG